jgi:thiamine biosynthesis protein ThiI
MERHLLVRFFHEIALKGKNQPFFRDAAHRAVEQALEGLTVGRIQRGPMMALVEVPEGTDLEQVKERLSTVIGVERVALAYKTPRELEQVKSLIQSLVAGRSFHSFRITARRTDKSFPLNSQEINQELGAFVQGLTEAKVDLERPELTIFVQVLQRAAFVYLDEWRGAGGMPVGVSGTVMSLLSGGIDSPVAAWRMLKRGCRAYFVHFHSFPLGDERSKEKAVELAHLLARYQFHSRLWLVPFGGVQQRIIASTPPPYRVVLYRRFMFRIAQALARKHGAEALVTGESVGQVSSQTLQNMAAIQEVVSLPVLRPLVGMDKEEIIQQAKHIGTYSISILPDQDCCSLFVPPHPVLRANLEEVRLLEEALDVEGMVREALEQVEMREFSWPSEGA